MIFEALVVVDLEVDGVEGNVVDEDDVTGTVVEEDVRETVVDEVEDEIDVVEEEDELEELTGGEASQAVIALVSRVTADPAYNPP